MSRLNRILLLIGLCLVMAMPAAADKKEAKQDRSAMRKEMREFHLKYLAQEMDLKEDQQKQFFDTYNQMMSERGVVFKETKRLEKQLSESKNVSDAEYEAATKALTTAKEKDAAIEKKYDEKFAKFLSSKQLYKMKEAEQKWRAKMHEMRHSKKAKKK